MQCCRLLLLNSGSYESSLRDGLSDYNIGFLGTSSPEEALHFIQDEVCGAVLWEIKQFSQKEIDFLQRILSLESKLPVIILAEEEPPQNLELFSLGIFALLKLPVNCVELLELVQSAFDIARHGDQIKIISATPSWIEVSIPAITTYIPRLSNWINKWMAGFSERDTQRLVFAFRELVQNAIEHGSHFCADKKVSIRYLIAKKFILFEIEDEGVGFNFGQIPHAAVGKRKNAAMEVMQYRKKIGMRPGGLGIASVQSIADELIYNQKGNKVTMVRYFPTDSKQEKDCK